MVDWKKRIEKITRSLRTSDHPMDVRIRYLLAERGVDVHSSLVANIMQEDSFLESGFIVTPEKRVYEFEYHYRDKPHEEATFRVWRDVSHAYQTRAFGEAIATAVAMVDRSEAVA